MIWFSSGFAAFQKWSVCKDLRAGTEPLLLQNSSKMQQPPQVNVSVQRAFSCVILKFTGFSVPFSTPAVCKLSQSIFLAKQTGQSFLEHFYDTSGITTLILIHRLAIIHRVT